MQISTPDGNVTISRVVVGATATAIIAATDLAREVLIINNSASVMDIGGSAVAPGTPGTGIPIGAGGSYRMTATTGSKGAWYAAITGGSGDCCVVEVK